ncbi:hypothetical protein E2C01_037278 [Portunus trituberculatus]|uniref:Uncharacterized protein n=1 Tax=Portunus trituberculatus TaxID=210409 RepID=A0A5B7FF75_PORTR|nr:hypothetical protein [Portunus trituberculatus]
MHASGLCYNRGRRTEVKNEGPVCGLTARESHMGKRRQPLHTHPPLWTVRATLPDAVSDRLVLQCAQMTCQIGKFLSSKIEFAFEVRSSEKERWRVFMKISAILLRRRSVETKLDL